MRHTPCGYYAGLRRGPLLGGWPCVSKVWGIVPQRSDFVSSFRLGTAGFWDMEQSDFTQHFQLRCSNPSGVLADTTSLYTREALVPSSSGSALENHSLLPRETDCHVAALAAPRNDPLEYCPCPFPVISAQTPFSVRCSSPRFAPCRIRSPAGRCGMRRGRSAGIPPEIPKTPARRRFPWAAALPAGG